MRPKNEKMNILSKLEVHYFDGTKKILNYSCYPNNIVKTYSNLNRKCYAKNRHNIKLIKIIEPTYLTDTNGWYYINEFSKYKINKYTQEIVSFVVPNKPKTIKPSVNNCGYVQVCIRDNNCKQQVMVIHNLMYSTFVGKPNGIIRHRDGNKMNNCLENLIDTGNSVSPMYDFYTVAYEA
jgi:hypothetical protein